METITIHDAIPNKTQKSDLSRVKSLQGLHLLRLNARKIKASITALKFYHGLEDAGYTESSVQYK